MNDEECPKQVIECLNLLWNHKSIYVTHMTLAIFINLNTKMSRLFTISLIAVNVLALKLGKYRKYLLEEHLNFNK